MKKMVEVWMSVAEVWMSSEFLIELLSEGTKFGNVIVTKGLPDGAVLVGAEYDPLGDVVRFIFTNCGDIASPILVEYIKEVEWDLPRNNQDD